jgi:hypothetical protein
MARKIFFSFHYERDAWRAAQVRNCDLIPNEDEYGIIDGVEWEQIERQGDAAIERWIEEQMQYTSVTVVLIGAQTAERPWVLHEIVESWNRGNAVVGLTIHNMKDQDKLQDTPGANPLALFTLPDGRLLSDVCKTYDWVGNDGRNNLGTWAEEAYQTRKSFGTNNTLAHAPGRATQVAPTVLKSASVPFVPRAPWCADNDTQ